MRCRQCGTRIMEKRNRRRRTCRRCHHINVKTRQIEAKKQANTLPQAWEIAPTDGLPPPPHRIYPPQSINVNMAPSYVGPSAPRPLPPINSVRRRA